MRKIYMHCLWIQEPCCRGETARCHCKFRSIRSVQTVAFL